MVYIRFLILLISCFSILLISAQVKPDIASIQVSKPTLFEDVELSKKELSIGDLVPDLEFSMLNYFKPNARVSEFRGKLLILDFWGTWCGACLGNFPKLDTLQYLFSDKLQILLLNSTTSTGDNKSKIANLLSKRKNLAQDIKLPIAITTDSLADKLFPHNEIPHYVWIGADGKVKNITSAKEITIENIQMAINGEVLNLPIKKDFCGDKLMDLPWDKIIIDDNFGYYTLFKKGKIENETPFSYIRLTNNTIDPENGRYRIRGWAMRNLPLLKMYEIAINLSPNFKHVFVNKTLILDVKDSSEIIYNPALSGKEMWERENLYTYDLVIPNNEEDSLSSYILRDINRFSGYYGRIEKRKLKCLVLIRNNNDDSKIKTKGGLAGNNLQGSDIPKYVHNSPISQLVSGIILSAKCVTVPVFDATNYSGNVDITLSSGFKDIINLRKDLNRHGLDLIEEDRVLDVFIISKK